MIDGIVEWQGQNLQIYDRLICFPGKKQKLHIVQIDNHTLNSSLKNHT